MGAANLAYKKSCLKFILRQPLLDSFKSLSLYTVVFVRNGQLLASFSTTRSQNSTTVCGRHSLTESVFVSSLSVRGLVGSFHFFDIFYVIIPSVWAAKVVTFFK